MIYHLSLHTAGMIAGAFLILVGLIGLVKPGFANVVQRFPRSRVAGIALLTICLAWTFWLLATIQMGEFSGFRRPRGWRGGHWEMNLPRQILWKVVLPAVAAPRW